MYIKNSFYTCRYTKKTMVSQRSSFYIILLKEARMATQAPIQEDIAPI